MNPILKTVPTAAIDSRDLVYVVTYPLSVPRAVLKSIRENGLITPPLLEVSSEGKRPRYRVICGWRRMHSAKRLNLTKIRAFVLRNPAGDSVEIKRRLLIALWDNLSQRQLNQAEVASWLEKIHSHCLPAEITRKFLPLFGLSPSAEQLRRYLSLAEANEHVKRAMVNGRLTIKDALLLAEMPVHDTRGFLQFVKRLHLGANLRREFFSLIREISRRDRLSIRELLERGELKLILNSTEPPAWQAEKVWELLRRWRFPELSHAEDLFSRLRQQLGLPPEIQLKAPKYFEDENYELILRFSSVLKATSLLQQLGDKQEQLLKLLEKMQELILGQDRL